MQHGFRTTQAQPQTRTSRILGRRRRPRVVLTGRGLRAADVEPVEGHTGYVGRHEAESTGQ